MYNGVFGIEHRRIEKSRELKDIELQEISIVDKPANKRKFLFIKSEGGDGHFMGLLDMIDELNENFDISDSEQAVVKNAFDIAQDMDVDEKDAIAALVILLVKAGTSEAPVQKVITQNSSDEDVDPFPSLGPAMEFEEEEIYVPSQERQEQALRTSFGL